MAKIRSQIKFLTNCQIGQVFPKTIENIHLPKYLKEFQKFSIKLSILRKAKRYLYSKSNNIKNHISNFINSSKYHRIISNFEEISKNVYYNSKIFYYEELIKKFNKLRPKSIKKIEDVKKTEDVKDGTDKKLVTDLSHSLTTSELKILSKGPNFALQKPINSKTINDINTNFCRLAYQILWNDKLNKLKLNEGNQQFIRYPYNKTFSDPQNDNQELGDKLKRIYSKIQDEIPKSTKYNISKDELQTLKELKKKDLVFLPSDKGKEFCVINENKYNEATRQHLSDNSVYQVVKKIQPSTLESKINKTWVDICKSVKLSKPIQKSFITHNSNIAKFYSLIKTHKLGNEIKVRPIVSNINSPNTKISWFLQFLLKPLLKDCPAHLESSIELIKSIRNLGTDILRTNNYPFSLDVVALYTSIPSQDAIQNICQRLKDKNFNYHGINEDDIRKLLESVINTTYFKFNNEIFKQVSGLPMGGCLSGTLAILFMDYIESKVVLNNNIVLYKRYVDDIFILCKNKEESNKILLEMNALHGNIKFEIEYPTQENSLSLLDFTVRINKNGTHELNFYKKPALKDIFINYNSAIPTETKINVIKEEIRRIKDRCSKKKEQKENINRFIEKLRTNDYPNDFIKQCRKSAKKKQTENKTKDKKIFYYDFPYISDEVNNRIKSIFAKEGIRIRLYDRKYTLRNFLKKKTKDSCKLKNCPLKNNHCLHKNVVYQLTCSKCNRNYIGSTIRELHTRVSEHLKDSRSSVFEHHLECNSEFSTKILDRARDQINLRIKEAIYIRNLKPELNTKQDFFDINNIIF